jgi:ankyrin repeat domain-containing protein 50
MATPSKEPTDAGTRSSSPLRIKQLFSRRQKNESSPPLKVEEKEVYWPQDLLPEDCANARILTWGYDSRVSHFFGGPANQSNVSAHARDLLYALEKKRLQCVRTSVVR